MATKISNEFKKIITLDDGSIMTLSKLGAEESAHFEIQSKGGIKGSMDISALDLNKLFVLFNAAYTDMANERA